MTMRWRPIAECPPDLRRAVVFDPDNARMFGAGEIEDERVVIAERRDDGSWEVDEYEGSYDIEPTHFLEPGVPNGFSTPPDPEPLRRRLEAERTEQAEREARWAAVRAAERASAVIEITDPTRLREMDDERERFWSDPDNLRRFLADET